MIVMKSTEDRAILLLTKELMKAHWKFLSPADKTILYIETLKNVHINFKDYWPQELDLTLSRIIEYSLVYLRLQFTSWHEKAGV